MVMIQDLTIACDVFPELQAIERLGLEYFIDERHKLRLFVKEIKLRISLN
jgi:hypothetical protein